MKGYTKLALLATGAVAVLGTELQAAPFTEPVFVAYFAPEAHTWKRGAAFMMHFVSWAESSPTWTVRNISWVDRWAGAGGSLDQPVMVWDPETDPNNMVDDRVPTWRRDAIPEPTTALMVTGLMGIVALRRRTI